MEDMIKTSPLDQVVGRLPKSTDQDELRIITLLKEELLALPEAEILFKKLKNHIVEYFKKSLAQRANPDKIHDITQETLQLLGSLANSSIVDGEENLSSLPKEQPVLAVVNHLGSYKLLGILPEELDISLPIDVIHPFPIYYAPLAPIGKILGNNLYEAHVELPQPLYEVQKGADLIIVPPTAGGTFKTLLERTGDLINRRPNSLIVVFPESGTSGKRISGGPYDLDYFRKGAFAIASNLNIPVLPVAQYFNPDPAKLGFEIGVLDPIMPKRNAGLDYFDTIARQTHEKMQKWLNERKSR